MQSSTLESLAGWPPDRIAMEPTTPDTCKDGIRLFGAAPCGSAADLKAVGT